MIWVCSNVFYIILCLVVATVAVALQVNAAPIDSLKLAAGWVILTLVLIQNASLSVAAVVLLGLFWAEVFGQLLRIGLSIDPDCGKPHFSWEDTLGHILFRWIALTCLVLASAHFQFLIFFEHHQFALICFLGLSLSTALAQSAATRQREARKPTQEILKSRLMLIALVLACVAQITPITADLALALSVLCILSLAMALLWKLPEISENAFAAKSMPTYAGQYVAATLPIIFRKMDMLLIPWIFPPQHAAIYVIARGVAHLVPLVIAALSTKLTAPLTDAFERGNHGMFVGVVARANLGILLIGGATSLSVLSVGPQVLSFFGIGTGGAQDVLLWCILAQSGPILFGATSTMMRVVKKKREAALIAGGGILVFGLLPSLIGINNTADLAMMYACVRLACAGITAVFLGVQFGILPGLTAILFRRIKLL